MPIYEYRCFNCEHGFETIQKYGEEPLTLCPECNQDTLHKLMSAGGFILKGSGWYKAGHSAGRVHDSNKSGSTK